MTDEVMLKSCPFCGEVEDINQSYRADRARNWPSFVQCDRCGAEIERANPHAAIAAWNTRAPTDCGEGLIERIYTAVAAEMCETERASWDGAIRTGIRRALADRQPDQRGGEVPWHGDRPEQVCEAIAAYWAEWEEDRAGRGTYSAGELAETAGEFATGLFDALAAAPRPAEQGEG